MKQYLNYGLAIIMSLSFVIFDNLFLNDNDFDIYLFIKQLGLLLMLSTLLVFVIENKNFFIYKPEKESIALGPPKFNPYINRKY